MMNGITYYKVQSPYYGDITKNCPLQGVEIDQNFLNLEGRDVKSVTINGTDMVITFLNGDFIHTSLKSTLETTYDFDDKNGVLRITNNGVTKEITGFSTSTSVNSAISEVVDTIATVGKISVDGSLIGNGKPNKPVGIAHTYQTGLYKPVKRLVDLANGDVLPSCKEAKPGDRYITHENYSEFGLLYNYEGVKRIACDLKCANKGWRIPTKEDWDDMLNSVEVCEKDRNHGSAMSNKHLGQIAGKLLKSTNMWRSGEGCNCSDNDCCQCHTPQPQCYEEMKKCDTPFIGEMGQQHIDCCGNPYEGLDKYGFKVLPIGYADDSKYYQYYLERAWFWTATNQEYTNAYTKRFTYNTNKVYQDITSTDFYLSLRLVKDYDGENFLENEEILDNVYPTVLMPSIKKGKTIWTAVNIGLANKDYKGIYPNDNLNILLSDKYFVNEWDGKKWLRNEVREGESVVIMDSPDAKTNVEYRVINGVLTNVSFLVYRDVMNATQPDITRLNDLIEEEIHRAQTAERQLQDSIDENREHLEQHDEELKVVNETLSDFDERIKSNRADLDATIEKLDQEIVNRINDVDEEQARAEEAEHQLQDSIDTEKTRAEEAETALHDQITQEQTRAEAKENELQTNIEAEQARAEEAERVLQVNIETECAERQTKDIELENNTLTQEGTEFNSESGVLTLKSFGSTNDITVQFSFNFGEI